MEDKVKKERSPQFPFIPLDMAVERLRAFEAQYSKHSARLTLAAKLWGYAEKSSGGIQTVAAVVAYGLMDDPGSGIERRLKVSDLGMRILKEARAELRNEAIKTAALKPRVISELWNAWGEKRPPDSECISILHLDKGFTEEAAQRVLRVYDATIRFAGLTATDKIVDDAIAEAASKLPPTSQILDKTVRRVEINTPPATLPPKPQVQLMSGERVVFAHELKPDQSFRVIVNGPVDEAVIKAIKKFAEFQEEMLKVLGDGKAKRDDSGGFE